MKVYISKYRNHWISPYTILEKVCFWEKDPDVFYNFEKEPNHRYEKLVDRLEPVCRGIQKILDFVHPPINYIKIDHYDTWSMDNTLAPIILSMLKQLKATKHGSGVVDLEDVPVELRYTNTEEYEEQHTFDFYKEHKIKEGNRDIHARWDWVLDEMIWAFEQICDDDSDAQFHSGEYDFKSVACEWDKDGKPTLYTFEKGPNDTHRFDEVGYTKHHERIQNGTRLFGKYYQHLWD